MPGQHSSKSPSSAHRWRRCPGAVNAERGLPDSSGYEAAEGTVFHHFAELSLRLGADPENFVGRVKSMPYSKQVSDFEWEDGEWEIEFTHDMARYMKNGLAMIESRVTPDSKLHIEQRLDLSPWLGDGQFGTGDVGIVNPVDRVITVFDWKYGQGIPVSPKDNDQAILYFLGVWNTYAADMFDNDPRKITVEIIIEQPRAPGGGGVWRTTAKKLLGVGEQIKIDSLAADDPNAPRVAGDHCKFCKRAAAGCYAVKDLVLSYLDLSEEQLVGAVDMGPHFEAHDRLTPEARASILLNMKTINNWLEGLRQSALQDALHGRPTPHQKIVDGRKSARVFSKRYQKTVERIMKRRIADGAYEQKLLTPAKAEAKLGRAAYIKLLSRYVEQAEGKPSLVPISDAREELPALVDHLDDLE